MTAADQEDVHRTIERIARESCGGFVACLASHNTGCGGCIRFETPQDHEWRVFVAGQGAGASRIEVLRAWLREHAQQRWPESSLPASYPRVLH
jgi:hypothetical protein